MRGDWFGEEQNQRQVDLSENGTENGETSEDVSWDNCVPENFDIQSS